MGILYYTGAQLFTTKYQVSHLYVLVYESIISLSYIHNEAILNQTFCAWPKMYFQKLFFYWEMGWLWWWWLGDMVQKFFQVCMFFPNILTTKGRCENTTFLRMVRDAWWWVSNFSYNFLITGPIFVLKLGKFLGERAESKSGEKSSVQP